MTLPPPDRRHRRRRRRRTRALRLLLGLLVVAFVFAAGLAVGEALHDNPRPGATTTTERTTTVGVP